MATQYRYSFSSKRTQCPVCKSPHSFAGFTTDRTNNELIDSTQYGFCHKCGETVFPNSETKSEALYIPIADNIKREADIPLLYEYYNKSMSRIYENNFVTWLLSLEIDNKRTRELIKQFDIGSDNLDNTAFWYRDINGELTNSKIISYSIQGKRLKDEDSKIFIGNEYSSAFNGFGLFINKEGQPAYKAFTKEKGYNTSGNIFGFRRLEQGDYEKIIIVESEKNCILASLIMPNYCFVAGGGANAMVVGRVSIVKKYAKLFDKTVCVLFDADKAGKENADKLIEKYQFINYTDSFTQYTGKADGYDIADFVHDSIKKNSIIDIIEIFDNNQSGNNTIELGVINQDKFPTKKLLTQYKLEKFISDNYNLRHNIIKCRYEYFEDNQWINVTDQFYNTLKSTLYANGIEGETPAIRQFIQSFRTPKYDAFIEYINSIPQYEPTDTNDYIRELADIVTIEQDDDLINYNNDLTRWYDYFTHWFVAIYAQATLQNCSQFILIFIGNGGIGKGRFASLILPKCLSEYVAGFDFDNADSKDSQLSMCQNIILDADELEYMNKSKQSLVKSIISKNSFWLRAPYGTTSQTYYRRSSFIGSSNPDKILADETGSRRFLIIRANRIDFNMITDSLLAKAYAQARYMYDVLGYNIHFTQEEIQIMDNYNEQFRNASLPEELLIKHFKPIEDHTYGLTSSEIFLRLIDMNNQVREWHNSRIGTILKKLGYTKKAVRVEKGANGTKVLYNIKEIELVSNYVSMN